MATVMSYRPSGVRRPSATSNNSQGAPTPDMSIMANPMPNLPLPAHHEKSASNDSDVSLSRKRKRKVRPQYPLDTTEKHVEYILVASFDIDRGSIMEYQHPAPIGGDEAMLAELMLPDGAHARKEDWTMFFLHKDTAVDEQQANSEASQAAKNDGDDELDQDDLEDDTETIEAPPLLYVLNLVTTKADSTAKRGAVCKAMAICTRHPFLHIYKPLLLLALEQYFRAPVPETLASLYDAVNAMDLSLMPRLTFSERAILQASSEIKDLFVEKFECLIQQRQGSTEAALPSSLSPNPAVRSRSGIPRDTHEFESVVPYNGIPIPVKIPTALSLETVGDFSLIALVQTFNTPHASSPQAFQTLHPHLTTSGPLTHPIIVLLNALLTQKRVMIIGHNLPSSQVAEAVLAACSLASGGILRGFIRHAFPYTDLTKIDDLLKVPGFIAGVTNPTFSIHSEWWDLLCDLSTGRMQISPKIEAVQPSEGVSFFQQGGHGWVMMQSAGVNVNALGPTISASGGGKDASHGTTSNADVTCDNVFMGYVMAAINERHGEAAVRAKFRQWVHKFTRVAAAFEELVYNTSALNAWAPTAADSSPTTPSSSRSFNVLQSAAVRAQLTKGNGYVWPSAADKLRELAANATRIEGWMKTRSYVNYTQDVEILHARRAVKDIDLLHLHDKLVRLRLGADLSAIVYLAICDAVRTDRQINELLITVLAGSAAGAGHGFGSMSSAPGGGGGGGGNSNGGKDGAGIATPGLGPVGGLFHLALGLLHPKLEVREAVAELLDGIRMHDAGRHFWDRLGGFEKAAWSRVRAAAAASSAGNSARRSETSGR